MIRRARPHRATRANKGIGGGAAGMDACAEASLARVKFSPD
jgi:hypothetical protein